MTGRPTKITFAEMRDSGVRGIAPTTSAAPRGLTDRLPHLARHHRSGRRLDRRRYAFEAGPRGRCRFGFRRCGQPFE
jgi:hypothetical protein